LCMTPATGNPVRRWATWNDSASRDRIRSCTNPFPPPAPRVRVLFCDVESERLGPLAAADRVLFDRNCAPLWTSQGCQGKRSRTSPSPCEGSMQCGSVDELLDVTVEGPVLDELKVEVLRTLEDRVQPGLTGDDGEQRHLYVVDQAGSHQRAVHREAAVRAQRHIGLLFEPGDDVDGITAHHGCGRPVERFFQRGRHPSPAISTSW